MTRRIIGICGVCAGLLASAASGQSWIASGYTGPGGINRGVFDYAQGSGNLTNFRYTTYGPSNDWGIAGVEQVGGVVYLLTTFHDNRLNIANFSGNSMSLTPLTTPLGSSAEGDVGYNPADGHFYTIENTPFTSTKSIWRITPGTWAASVAGTFQGDDPSGIAFDNAGNAFVLDTHGNGSGIADLLRFDVMSNPGVATFQSSASLGFGTGPTCGMDFNSFTNELYVMSLSGNLFRINNYLTNAPQGQFIEHAAGADYITGLAFVPSPGALALMGAGALVAARRRR